MFYFYTIKAVDTFQYGTYCLASGYPLSKVPVNNEGKRKEMSEF